VNEHVHDKLIIPWLLDERARKPAVAVVTVSHWPSITVVVHTRLILHWTLSGELDEVFTQSFSLCKIHRYTSIHIYAHVQ
jgi:hypothetical protein